MCLNKTWFPMKLVSRSATLTCPTDEPLTACVKDTVSVVFNAANCNTSQRSEIVSFSPVVGGATLLDVTPATPQTVAAGQTIPITVRMIMPAECAGAASVQLNLSAYVAGDDACITRKSLTKQVRCVEPCIKAFRSDAKRSA